MALTERTVEVAIDLVKRELNMVNQWVAEARAMGGRSPRYFQDMANRREKLIAAQEELTDLSHTLRRLHAGQPEPYSL